MDARLLVDDRSFGPGHQSLEDRIIGLLEEIVQSGLKLLVGDGVVGVVDQVVAFGRIEVEVVELAAARITSPMPLTSKNRLARPLSMLGSTYLRNSLS